MRIRPRSSRRGAAALAAQLSERGLCRLRALRHALRRVLHGLRVHPDGAPDCVRARRGRRAAGCSCRGSRSSMHRRTPRSRRSRTTTSTRASGIRWRRSSSCSARSACVSGVGADHDGYPWVFGYRGPSLGELGSRADAGRRISSRTRWRSRARLSLRSCARAASGRNLAHTLLQRYTRPGVSETEVTNRASTEATYAMLDEIGPIYRGQSQWFDGAIRFPRPDRPKRGDPARAPEQHRLRGRGRAGDGRDGAGLGLPLVARRPDHHRPLELRVVTPHRRRRSRHQHVARLEDDVVRERVRDRSVPADLAAVAGDRAVEPLDSARDRAARSRRASRRSPPSTRGVSTSVSETPGPRVPLQERVREIRPLAALA